MSFAVCCLTFEARSAWAAAPAGGYYSQGVDLYKAGRYSDAVDSFDQALKHKDHVQEAQDYIDRIRKETVERIRNKALTGVNKANWQSKFYFMNEVDNRVRVGISVQELFERDSLNFRPGAVEALNQLGAIFAKAENAHFDVELINEVNPETPPERHLDGSASYDSLFLFISCLARRSAEILK